MRLVIISLIAILGAAENASACNSQTLKVITEGCSNNIADMSTQRCFQNALLALGENAPLPHLVYRMYQKVNGASATSFCIRRAAKTANNPELTEILAQRGCRKKEESWLETATDELTGREAENCMRENLKRYVSSHPMPKTGNMVAPIAAGR